MPRWPRHMTKSGYPDDPEAAIGLYSAFGGMRGAYAVDYLDRVQRKSDQQKPGREPEEPLR